MSMLGLASFPLRFIPAGHVNMDFSAISVTDIPKEYSVKFWSNSSEISERTRQKGLQYAFEKYIHNIICRRSNVEGKDIKIEAKASPLQDS